MYRFYFETFLSNNILVSTKSLIEERSEMYAYNQLTLCYEI